MPSMQDTKTAEAEAAKAVKAAKAAVILIDLQNEFLLPKGMYGYGCVPSNHLLKNVTNLVHHCNKNKIPVFWIKSVYGTLSKEEIEECKKKEFLDRCHIGKRSCCKENSRMAEFFDPVKSLIQKQYSHHIVEKKYYNSFCNTSLKKELDSLKITDLLIGGVVTNVCVHATSIGADKLGYNVTILEDCCGATSTKRHSTAINEMKKFCTIDTSSNLFKNSNGNGHYRYATVSNIGYGDSRMLYNVFPNTTDWFDKIKKEVDWQKMDHKGQAVSRLISIQGDSDENLEPLYRHPADQQPFRI